MAYFAGIDDMKPFLGGAPDPRFLRYETCLLQSRQIFLKLSETQLGFIHYDCLLLSIYSAFQNFHDDTVPCSPLKSLLRH